MRRLLTIAALLGLLTRSAAAQSAEISCGYSLARDPRDEVTLHTGWMAGAALPLTSAFSIVADASGQYATLPLLDAQATLSMHAVMGGVRASARVGRLTEFG